MKDMSCSPYRCDASAPGDAGAVKALLAEVGAVASGIAVAGRVADSDFGRFEDWLARGCHGDMRYMENYRDLRRDPRGLLPGARSVITAAFSYYHSDSTEGNLERIAAYAHGDDYHEVVRERLGRVAGRISEMYGGATRACVDTAPLLERYWAVRAGVGFIGHNGMLIVPGAGSYVFIGTILATVPFTPDRPSESSCIGCGRCLAECPAKALSARGVDASRCLSYLTIEHRGEFPEGTELHGRLYGCDICQRVCPHNSGLTDTAIDRFYPRAPLRDLTPEKIVTMTQEEFSDMMRLSAIKRTRLAGLRRNAIKLLEEGDNVR